MFEGTPYNISSVNCQNMGWSSRKGHYTSQTAELETAIIVGVQAAAWTREGVLGLSFRNATPLV
jgi:hypothetical protein